MSLAPPSEGPTYRAAMTARRWVVRLERVWDGSRLRRAGSRTPTYFRITPYIGHGGAERVVVRGRVLDDQPTAAAVDGERTIDAVRRTLRHFFTDELPGVPLRITVAGATVETVTDEEGYFVAALSPVADITSPWSTGTVELAGDYRGVTGPQATPVEVRVPGPEARFGIISDIDDTIIETGVQRVARMIRQTLTGSELTRTPFPGAADLYRDLAAGEVNPVFYVSSSPWNLYGFLVAFLRHRDFPLGPVMLRDLLGTGSGREAKSGRIREILDQYPQLRFVLLGDSGERDPEIYADIVRSYPGRVLAVYIREVRLDPGDGRVEKVSTAWSSDVPFVLAADSDAVRRHAAELGLL